jgi:hypothetical protein
VGKLVGVIASVLIGLALAAGGAFAVTSVGAPDKDVELENPDTPNGAPPREGAAAVVNYGSR